MGIRTPGLLHAMESRPVHASPRQFTSNPAEQVIRSDCIASVHQSSPRTVTSLVTSRPHTRACPHNPSLFRVHAPCLAGPLPQPVRQAPHAPGSAHHLGPHQRGRSRRGGHPADTDRAAARDAGAGRPRRYPAVTTGPGVMSAAPAGALERPVAQNPALPDLPLTGPGGIGYAALGDGESVTDETIQGLEAKLAGRGTPREPAPRAGVLPCLPPGRAAHPASLGTHRRGNTGGPACAGHASSRRRKGSLIRTDVRPHGSGGQSCLRLYLAKRAIARVWGEALPGEPAWQDGSWCGRVTWRRCRRCGGPVAATEQVPGPGAFIKGLPAGGGG